MQPKVRRVYVPKAKLVVLLFGVFFVLLLE